MKIVIDSDVSKVADFMLNNVRAAELNRVAHAIADLADFVWKPEYIARERKPFFLKWADEIKAPESRQLLVSKPRNGVSREASDLQGSNGRRKLLH
jgi:hypothetical protein